MVERKKMSKKVAVSKGASSVVVYPNSDEISLVKRRKISMSRKLTVSKGASSVVVWGDEVVKSF